MTTTQITDKLKNITNFIGVYPHDKLPIFDKPINKKSSFVINLDDSDGPGTHWVAIYGNHYFDSFGIAPSTRIKSFMRKIFNLKPNDIHYLSHQIQKMDSNRCGYYCIYFIKQMNNGKTFNDIVLDDFNMTSLDKNENIIL